MPRIHVCLFLVAAVTACGGGGGAASGGADYCLAHFMDGSTQGSCPDCTSSNYSVARTVFNRGGNAGALARFPSGQYQNIGIRFQTYLAGANNTVGTNGEFTATGNISGNGSDRYYSFNPNADFDAIEVVVNLGGNSQPASVRLYEICADR